MKRYFVTATVTIQAIVTAPDNETPEHIQQSVQDAIEAIDFERSMSDGTQTSFGQIQSTDIDNEMTEIVDEDEENAQ